MGLLSLNSNCIIIDGLTVKDENGVSSFVNDATADVTLTIDDVDVTGETWPLNIPFVVGSDGRYFKALAADIGISKGDKVRVEVNAVSSSGTAKWDEIVRVNDRPLDDCA